MLSLFFNYYINSIIFVFLPLLFVIIYEIINGFHDSANSVAIVIYTKSLSPKIAIILSSICNFLGVFFGGLSVAYSIMHLFPLEFLITLHSTDGIKMIFSVLLSSIFWNFFTWYVGLPISSSHTLIGAILGVSITDSIIKNGSIIHSIDILKFKSIFLSFIISPFLGVFFSGLFLLIIKKVFYKFYNSCYIDSNIFHKSQSKKKKLPTFFIKSMIIFSSMSVSYAHGANDGQKGIGLILLILITITPSQYLISFNNPSTIEVKNIQFAIYNFKILLFKNNINLQNKYFLLKNGKNIFNIQDIKFLKENIQNDFLPLILYLDYISELLNNYNNCSYNEKNQIIKIFLYTKHIIPNIIKQISIQEEKIFLQDIDTELTKLVEKTPFWVIFIVALSIAIGTTMGWERIFKTIGKKIGEKKMSYSQAISSQIATSIAVLLASYLGLPVSTTHVLSSSITGSMIIDGYKLQIKTIQKIIYAWLFTLPVAIFLSGLIYFLLLNI